MKPAFLAFIVCFVATKKGEGEKERMKERNNRWLAN